MAATANGAQRRQSALLRRDGIDGVVLELLPRQRGRMARVRDREDGPRARLPPRRDP